MKKGSCFFISYVAMTLLLPVLLLYPTLIYYDLAGFTMIWQVWVDMMDLHLLN